MRGVNQENIWGGFRYFDFFIFGFQKIDPSGYDPAQLVPLLNFKIW